MSFTLPVQGLHQFDIFISTSDTSESGLSWKLEPKVHSPLISSASNDNNPKMSFSLVEKGDQNGLRISLSQPLESREAASNEGTLV